MDKCDDAEDEVERVEIEQSWKTNHTLADHVAEIKELEAQLKKISSTKHTVTLTKLTKFIERKICAKLLQNN